MPEVEHDERHFFWNKKNKTIICCLNSLCRTLLESNILWISETMKNSFHDLFLVEIWCPSFIFAHHKLFMIFKVGLLNTAVYSEKAVSTLNFLKGMFSTECSCLGIKGYFMQITLTECCWCAMVTHWFARENNWQPVLVEELKLVAIWQKWGGVGESHSQ